jgi:ketosteroid isomerase-like protein
MIKLLKYCLFSVMLLSSLCFSKNVDVSAEIKYKIIQSVKAWNRGDLVGFMSVYDKSNSLLFIDKEYSTGYQHVLQSYLKNYSNKKSMGVLSLCDLEVKVLSKKYAFVIGKWSLTMPNAKSTEHGYTTLLFENTKDGWKAIVDHSSAI